MNNRLAALLLGDRSRHTGLARLKAYRQSTDPAGRAAFPADEHADRSQLLVPLRLVAAAGGAPAPAP